MFRVPLPRSTNFQTSTPIAGEPFHISYTGITMAHNVQGIQYRWSFDTEIASVLKTTMSGMLNSRPDASLPRFRIRLDGEMGLIHLCKG